MPSLHPLDPALLPADVFARLGDRERRLLVAAKTLYGDLADAAEDLRRRMAGRPYLYQLPGDPAAALPWLERLARYELACGTTFDEVVDAAVGSLSEVSR